MSELSIYEVDDTLKLEDRAWDELCTTGDHTVPGVEQEKETSLLRNNCKRPCHGAVGVEGNFRHKSSYQELGLINNRRNKRMMETDLVPNKPDNVFNFCNGIPDKEDDRLAPVSNRRFSHCFESNNMDGIGSEFCVSTENDVNFFDETHDIKDSGDFIYYGWPDICNLEDLDRIFSNEDGLGWFASSEDVEASINGGSNLEFKLSCSEYDFKSIEQGNEIIPEVQNKTHDTVSSTNGYNQMATLRDQSRGGRKYTHSDYSLPSEYGMMTYQTPSEKLNYEDALESSFSAKPENIDMAIQVPFFNPVSTQKEVQQQLNKFDILDDDAQKVPSELGPTIVEPASDDNSLEAASFCQLLLVMKQLDLRTKLCIRDSLYRLARSAAQRHTNENLHHHTETMNMCNGFIDMETDSNPIDRSIAGLLFQKPSDTSTNTTTQVSSFHNTVTAISF